MGSVAERSSFGAANRRARAEIARLTPAYIKALFKLHVGMLAPEQVKRGWLLWVSKQRDLILKDWKSAFRAYQSWLNQTGRTPVWHEERSRVAQCLESLACMDQRLSEFNFNFFARNVDADPLIQMQMDKYYNSPVIFPKVGKVLLRKVDHTRDGYEMRFAGKDGADLLIRHYKNGKYAVYWNDGYDDWAGAMWPGPQGRSEYGQIARLIGKVRKGKYKRA